MTRINCGIKPFELSDKHLLAEHREIKRIPNQISKGRYNMDNIPDKFTLGTGHCKFFYNKLLYLKKRYISIYNECKKRNFNVTNYLESFENLPSELLNDYSEQKRDRLILMSRLLERDYEFYLKYNDGIQYL